METRLNESITVRNHHVVAGCFLVYFIQSLVMLMKMHKENLYFGNLKPDSLHVNQQDKVVKINNFSTALMMQPDCNYVKGLTYKYATKEVVDKVIYGESLTAESLKRNDINALFVTFGVLLYQIEESTSYL